MARDPDLIRCIISACRVLYGRSEDDPVGVTDYLDAERILDAIDGGLLSEEELNNDPQKSTTFCGCDDGANYQCERHRSGGIDLSTPAAEMAHSPYVPPVASSVTRKQFSSGMMRDQDTNKIDYTRVLDGPMLDRWADHLTKNETRYPDVQPGVANWTLANGREELERFRKSAFRHFRQWLRGDSDEDHAAAIIFNINGYEYVKLTLGRGAEQINQG